MSVSLWIHFTYPKQRFLFQKWHFYWLGNLIVLVYMAFVNSQSLTHKSFPLLSLWTGFSIFNYYFPLRLLSWALELELANVFSSLMSAGEVKLDTRLCYKCCLLYVENAHRFEMQLFKIKLSSLGFVHLVWACAFHTKLWNKLFSSINSFLVSEIIQSSLKQRCWPIQSKPYSTQLSRHIFVSRLPVFAMGNNILRT